MALLGAAFLALGVIPAGALAAAELSITTPYPAVSVAPGSKVSFDLHLSAKEDRRVALAVSGVPDGWQAVLHGGGYVVNSVLVGPDSTPSVRLDVTVPADAAAKTYSMTVTAASGALTDSLAIDVTVNASAAGSVALTTDFPILKGPSTTSFRFTLTLANDTAEDLTFSLEAHGPTPDWQVAARPSSQSQAASFQVNAGSSTSIVVEASPPNAIDAGQYVLDVTATSGDHKAEAQLGVEITGQYSMDLTTPDQRLNANGQAGSVIERTLSVVNNGTAALTDVTLSATPPSGWKVDFVPPKVDSIDPGQTQTVTAKITPSTQAIAGDYVVTFTASAKDASSASVNIRVTVETSPIWAVVGILLIVAVLAGLGWVFQRYGRR